MNIVRALCKIHSIDDDFSRIKAAKPLVDSKVDELVVLGGCHIGAAADYSNNFHRDRYIDFEEEFSDRKRSPWIKVFR